MTTLREAAQQALEAMESVEWYGAGSGWIVDAEAIEKSITALKAALLGDTDGHEVARNVQAYRRGWDAGFSAGVAAPVKAEPITEAESITDAMMNLVDRLGSEADQVEPRAWHHLLVYAPKQKPSQEPIGWFGYDKSIGTWFETNEGDDDSVPLYTAPSQRKPLTEEEIHDCWQQKHRDKVTERRLITRAVERAHGIGGSK